MDDIPFEKIAKRMYPTGNLIQAVSSLRKLAAAIRAQAVQAKAAKLHLCPQDWYFRDDQIALDVVLQGLLEGGFVPKDWRGRLPKEFSPSTLFNAFVDRVSETFPLIDSDGPPGDNYDRWAWAVEWLASALMRRVPTGKPPTAKDGKGGTPKASRRGAPPATDPKEDKRISDAWATGAHQSHEALSVAMGKGLREVKLALDRHRKRQRNLAPE